MRTARLWLATWRCIALGAALRVRLAWWRLRCAYLKAALEDIPHWQWDRSLAEREYWKAYSAMQRAWRSL